VASVLWLLDRSQDGFLGIGRVAGDFEGALGGVLGPISGLGDGGGGPAGRSGRADGYGSCFVLAFIGGRGLCGASRR
jgi:hypothetical protein